MISNIIMNTADDPIVNRWLRMSKYGNRYCIANSKPFMPHLSQLNSNMKPPPFIPWESELVIFKGDYIAWNKAKYIECGGHANAQMSKARRPTHAYSSLGIHKDRTYYVSYKGVAADVPNIENAGRFVIGQLDKIRPVKTFIANGWSNSKNSCGANHVVTVVSYGMDKHGFYFRFFDNGGPLQATGTSPKNRIYYESATREFKSVEPIEVYSHTYYLITQFRMNKESF